MGFLQGSQCITLIYVLLVPTVVCTAVVVNPANVISIKNSITSSAQSLSVYPRTTVNLFVNNKFESSVTVNNRQTDYLSRYTHCSSWPPTSVLPPMYQVTGTDAGALVTGDGGMLNVICRDSAVIRWTTVCDFTLVCSMSSGGGGRAAMVMDPTASYSPVVEPLVNHMPQLAFRLNAKPWKTIALRSACLDAQRCCQITLCDGSSSNPNGAECFVNYNSGTLLINNTVSNTSLTNVSLDSNGTDSTSNAATLSLVSAPLVFDVVPEVLSGILDVASTLGYTLRIPVSSEMVSWNPLSSGGDAAWLAQQSAPFIINGTVINTDPAVDPIIANLTSFYNVTVSSIRDAAACSFTSFQEGFIVNTINTLTTRVLKYTSSNPHNLHLTSTHDSHVELTQATHSQPHVLADPVVTGDISIVTVNETHRSVIFNPATNTYVSSVRWTCCVRKTTECAACMIIGCLLPFPGTWYAAIVFAAEAARCAASCVDCVQFNARSTIKNQAARLEQRRSCSNITQPVVYEPSEFLLSSGSPTQNKQPNTTTNTTTKAASTAAYTSITPTWMYSVISIIVLLAML